MPNGVTYSQQVAQDADGNISLTKGSESADGSETTTSFGLTETGEAQLTEKSSDSEQLFIHSFVTVLGSDEKIKVTTIAEP